MNIHVHVHTDGIDSTSLNKLSEFLPELKKMATTLDDILAQVSEQTTLLKSLDTFIEGIFDKLRELELTKQDQVKIEKLATELQANKQAIVDSFVDNVAPEPEPPLVDNTTPGVDGVVPSPAETAKGRGR